MDSLADIFNGRNWACLSEFSHLNNAGLVGDAGFLKVINPSWCSYRLGDIFRLQEDAVKALDIGSFSDHSIGRKFVARVRDPSITTGSSVSDMTAVLSEFDGVFNSPAPRELCVHVRLGDMPTIKKTNTDLHFKEMAKGVSDFVKLVNPSTVTVMSAIHFGGELKTRSTGKIYKQAELFSVFMSELRRLGVPVGQIMSSSNPDVDFYYLANADYAVSVIPSGFFRAAVSVGNKNVLPCVIAFSDKNGQPKAELRRCGVYTGSRLGAKNIGTYVVLSTATRVGSTLLSNILNGLLSPHDPIIYFYKCHSLRDLDRLIFTRNPVVVYKTHLPLSEISVPEGSKLVGVTIQRKGFDTSLYQEGVIRFDYDELLFSNRNDLRDVVVRVVSKLQPHFPELDLEGQVESCIRRVENMEAVCESIKNLPFELYSPFYAVHGSHRNRGNKQQSCQK